MSFKCPVCKTNVELGSFTDIRDDIYDHLNGHKENGEVVLPLLCKQTDNCLSRLSSIRHYVDHFASFHPVQVQAAENRGYQNIESEHELSSDEESVHYDNSVLGENREMENLSENGDNIMSGDNSSQEENSESEGEDEDEDEFLTDLKNSAFNMLLGFRSKNAIPYTTTIEIVNHVKSFVTSVIQKSVAIVNQELADNVENNATRRENIIAKLNLIPSVFSALETEWKVRKMYERHPRFVLPKTVKMSYNVKTQKFNTAQYVSIQETMQALVLDQEFADILLNPNPVLIEPNNGGAVYSEYKNGSRHAENELFSSSHLPNSPKIKLQVFADGVNFNNAMRPTKHNGMMFYFTLLDLPPRFNSALANIHLIAICNSKETEAYDKILDYIVHEVKILETTGFELTVPHRGKVRIYGTIVQFTADNLGLNQMFGLVQSFNCDFFCALCYATKAQIQIHYQEKYFELRSPEKYEQDLLELEISGSLNVRGVIRPCVLNTLLFFKIMANWINDCMHTVLEGIIPYVMACILHTFIYSQKIFTLDQLNDTIQSVFRLLKINKKNKPALLKKICGPPEMAISPSLKAAQNWALCLYLPLILSKLVRNKRDKNLKLLSMLQEVVDIVMAPKFTDAMLYQFDQRYAEFLTLFKKLYPNQPIRPKMHFLVHFSTIVRKNGPMRNYWAMNYERLNGEIKKAAHTMNNFKDAKKTLAFKRQTAMLHAQLSKSSLRDSVIFGSIGECPVYDFPRAELLRFIQPDGEFIQVSQKATINGVVYAKDMFVALKEENSLQGDSLRFWRIETVICDDVNNPLFLLETYSTLEFDDNSYCYILQRIVPSVFRIRKLQHFLDFHPLDCIKYDGKMCVRLKYYIW